MKAYFKVVFREFFYSSFRPAFCTYKTLGCTWEGMWHQKEAHGKVCLFPQKTGLDLLESVTALAGNTTEEINRLNGLLKMLSYEKVAICGRKKLRMVFYCVF